MAVPSFLRNTKLETPVESVYTRCNIENPVERSRSVIIPKLLVDTRSEYTWVFEGALAPRFITAFPGEDS